MNFKMLIAIAGTILLIIGGLYIQQGGLKSVDVVQAHENRRYIIGKPFEGNINNEAFAEMFDEIKNLKEENALDGYLSTMYYNDPKESKGNINAFFGVLFNIKPNDIEGFEIRSIDEGEYLQGSIKASIAFVNKTYNAIFDYAEENDIQLKDEYLEWFPSENEIRVQIKIKNE